MKRYFVDGFDDLILLFENFTVWLFEVWLVLNAVK